MKSRIMYIELKESNKILDSGSLSNFARIGKVEFSKTGKSIYYDGKTFQSLKGRGFKANYFDIETDEEYWISGCRKDGLDRLYNERLPIEIDENIRKEYWLEIRDLPSNVKKSRIN